MKGIFTRLCCIAIALQVLVAQRSADAQFVGFDNITTTYAGNGEYGYTDGPASSARFFSPMGVSVDAAGNVYVADNINKSIVRKVTPGGVVSTVAGTGVQGYSTGTVASANFSLPTFAAMVGGDLYVADNGNHQIRVISGGNVNSFVGSLTYGFEDGIGTAAKFMQPHSFVLDGLGNMYVTDLFNHAIRKVNMATKAVTTIAGNGSPGFVDGAGSAAQFSSPFGIDIDADGNLIVADYHNSSIRKVTPAGEVSTIAGNGSSGYLDGGLAVARFNRPAGVAVASDGSIYISDCFNNCIRKISNGTVNTIAGTTASGYLNGFGSMAAFYHPYGLDIDAAGNLYVADELNDVVRKISVHTISPFVTVEGLATSSKEFGVNGKNLTGNLIVTAPAGFEISLNAYTGFSASLSLTPVSGTVSSTQLYIRVSASAVSGTYNSNIEITSTGAATQYLNVKATVNPNVATPVILNGMTVIKYTKVATNGYVDGTVDLAQFYGINDIVSDIAGNIYVADYQNHKIRKITPSGVVSTLAGSTSGYADGVGTAAQFKNPSGVAVDINGNVYVAESGNHRIRKILPDGTVSTIAGSGVAGTANGTGTAAQFYNPRSIAVDVLGNLYVTQSGNTILRKIDPSGVVTNFITTFNYPAGLVCDFSGNLYVSDQSNQRICKVTPAGAITVIAGVTGSAGSTDGVGTVARFNYPSDLSLDGNGNVYVSDLQNNCMRKITPTGMVLTIGYSSSSVSSNAEGSSATAYFTNPPTVAVKPDGTVFMASGGYIFKIAEPYTLRTFSTVVGSPSYSQTYPVIAGTTNNVQVTAPAGFEVSLNGSTFSSSISIVPTNGAIARTSIYIRVSATASAGTLGDTITMTTTNSNTVKIPVAAIVGSNGGVVYFERTVSTSAGTTLGYQDGPVASAQFQYVTGVVMDVDQNMYVADRATHCIRKVTPAGVVSTFAGTNTSGFADGNSTAARFNSPRHLAIDASGNIYVCDYGNNCIRKITPSGTVSTLAGGTQGYLDGMGTAAQFKQPYGIALDVSGNIFVSDYGNNRIRKITPAGLVTTVAGNGLASYFDAGALNACFNGPRGLAFAKSGNLLIADYSNHCIRQLSTDGYVSTFAGANSTGDVNGIAINARFYYPAAITVDTSGMIYVTDAFNYKIKQITPGGVVTTVAGSTSGLVDGAPATSRFAMPTAITVDGTNHLFVCDENNSRVRKLALPAMTFATNIGVASAHQNFRVSASRITGNLTVTAPAGYEVSLTSGSGYSASLNLVPSSGAVTNQLVYIRLAAPAAGGTYNGNIVLSSTNAASVALAVTGLVPVSKTDQTITFDPLADRIYGGASFTLAATSSSGLTVTYTSSNPAVATVSGNTVTITGAGSTTITANQSGDIFYNAAPSVPQTLTVQKANQTITFNALAAKAYGNAPFNPGATVSSGLAITYVSSNTSVATVSGTTVTIVGVGTADITASQPGNINYNAATNVMQTLTVNKASQTITFNAITAKTYGGANFNLTATASSGLAVTYVSSNTSVATIAGNTVTIVGVGTADITASQAGNANYDAAADIIRTLTVNKAGQTITFGTLTAKTYGDPDFTLAGTAGSGLTVSYASSNTAVATISGNTVTIVGAGTTNITASQSGNSNYNPATNVVRALTVNKAAQTITFAALADKVVGDADFTLNGTVNSGLTIVYTSSNTAVATVSGNVVTIVGAGTTNITASQAGNTNYNVATSVIRPLVVNKNNQTITFDPITDKFVDDANFTLSAASNSGLGITYLSSNNAVATVSGNTVSIVGPGTVTITASQGGDAMYNPASDVTRSFTVVKHEQTITFDPITDKFADDASFTLSATSSSGLVITYVSSDPSVATVSGNEITIVGLGTTTITASQGGNVIYNAAADVVRSFSVVKRDQIITFDPIAGKYVNDADFILNATSNTATPILYSSSDLSVATISGNTVTLVGAGSAVITASQAASGSYNAASATQTLVVTKRSQSITFAALPPKSTNNPDFTLGGIASSGLTVTYISTNTSVATISGNVVTIVGAGTTEIIASQPGDAIYDAAVSVSRTLTVSIVEGIESAEFSVIKIYPNPVASMLYIEPSNSLAGIVTLTILNSLGAEVYSINGDGQEIFKTDMSQLSPGVYTVKISNGLKQITEKIIKH